MLNELERRVVAIVADITVQRTHLTVVGGPIPQALPAAAKGRIVVTIEDFTPGNAFLPETIRDKTSPAVSKRVLTLGGAIRLTFQMQPASGSAADLDTARGLMLEDMSLVGHALADQPIATGTFFDTGNDSGFRVLSFALQSGSGQVDLPPSILSGELLYACQSEIWPPTAAQPAGTMDGISTVMTTLPVDGSTAERVVSAGHPIVLRVTSLPSERPAAKNQPAVPLRLAVTVLSTAPPASRGTVTSGAAGPEAGVKIIPVTKPETSITFQAPALASGERTEYVALHFATPDDKTGVFLGSIAVRIRGGN